MRSTLHGHGVLILVYVCTTLPSSAIERSFPDVSLYKRLSMVGRIDTFGLTYVDIVWNHTDGYIIGVNNSMRRVPAALNI